MFLVNEELNHTREYGMKKTLLLGLIALFSTSTFSAVVTSFDSKNHCTLYRSVSADSNGGMKLGDGETIFLDRDVYGFSIKDMEIDFDRREVLVQPMINIVLGFNKELISSKVKITSDNPHFSSLVNQLNHTVSLFDKICLSHDDKIIYAEGAEN